MPYIVPNATDIGPLYKDLNQAEPDALDFQILGDRSTGVLTGCTVTATPVSSTSVRVTEGFVALKGVVYKLYRNGSQVTNFADVGLPSIISNNKRFDLVVGRLTDGNMEITMLTGPESETNPTFPASPSRLSPLPSVPTQYFNPETDVMLASVYRIGGTNTTNAHIVDKRVNVMSTTMIRGEANPSSTFGYDGDFYYKLNPGANKSGLYIKRNGSWVELILAEDFSNLNPIGAIIAWPSATPPSSEYWRECDGSTLSKLEYSTLYSLLGSTYGAETATFFSLPDFRNKFLRGNAAAGGGGGSDSVALSTDNLPAHTHSIAGHTHDIGSHTHSISANSRTAVTNEAGGHAHTGDNAGNPIVVRLVTNPLGNYIAPYSSYGAGYGDGIHYNRAGGGPGGEVTSRPGITVNSSPSSPTTNTAGTHSHTFNVDFTAAIEPATAGTTGTSLQSATGSVGSGTAFSNLPVFANVRWFIRVK